MQPSFIVKKSDGTTDVTYKLRSSGNTTDYVDTSSSPAALRQAWISHSMKPIGSRGSDRHTVLFQSVVLDADGNPQIVSDSRTITVPRSAAVTDVIVKDVIAAQNGYWALSGMVDATLDGITY
jgi:hypothetical protein